MSLCANIATSFYTDYNLYPFLLTSINDIANQYSQIRSYIIHVDFASPVLTTIRTYTTTYAGSFVHMSIVPVVGVGKDGRTVIGPGLPE